jgi:N6-L-threonylcarbamoyladenine synthase
VVDQALKQADCELKDLDAIAYTRGPGLLGSLLVGSAFAKGLSLGTKIPLIEVNHMKAHILAHFIDDNSSTPNFPFLCLTVSGGHTQIVKVISPGNMEVLGRTLDDAAGEAFDKAAKMMGLPYPGGPLIDQYAQKGDEKRFHFKVGEMDHFDFSFSGLKTGILYFLQKEVQKDRDFMLRNRADLCASIQKCIIDALLNKLELAVSKTGINEIAIAGGVSANSALREKLQAYEAKGWKVHVPKFEYCTDNAAMIAIAGHFKFLANDFSNLDAAPLARMQF